MSKSSSIFSPKFLLLVVFCALLFLLVKLSLPPVEPRMPGATVMPTLSLPRTVETPSIETTPEGVASPTNGEPAKDETQKSAPSPDNESWD